MCAELKQDFSLELKFKVMYRTQPRLLSGITIQSEVTELNTDFSLELQFIVMYRTQHKLLSGITIHSDVQISTQTSLWNYNS